MSTEQSKQTSGNDGGGGSGASAGEDLASALGGGSETEFVVSSDEKKPATQQFVFLVLLVVVGAGFLYFMYMRQGPAAAEAATNPEAQKAEETNNTFLTSGPDGIKMMQSMLKDTEKVVKQFLDYPSVTQIPLSSLHTNPFRFASASGTPEGANMDEEVLKRKREEEKQAAIKACDALKLQSIIAGGSRKACMINNTLYQEGQQVDIFTIEKIEPARVIVKTGTYRFELKGKR